MAARVAVMLGQNADGGGEAGTNSSQTDDTIELAGERARAPLSAPEDLEAARFGGMPFGWRDGAYHTVASQEDRARQIAAAH